MNRSFYLMVIAICVTANYGLNLVAYAAPSSTPQKTIAGIDNSLYASNRVVRQAPPEFTPPTPPPGMFPDKFSRKKREAKGGGSMPTRKG